MESAVNPDWSDLDERSDKESSLSRGAGEPYEKSQSEGTFSAWRDEEKDSDCDDNDDDEFDFLVKQNDEDGKYILNAIFHLRKFSHTFCNLIG